MTNTKSIAQRLHEAGYGYRVDRAHDGRNTVYSLENGCTLGRFDAFEAVEFLKTVER